MAGHQPARGSAARSHELAFRPPVQMPRPLHSLQHARLALGDDWMTARRRLRALL